jgi:hypothetical protein
MTQHPTLEKTKKHKQDYGDDPLAVRESDKYVEEYIKGFVDKWDELIDWDARAESEGHFFIDILKDMGKKKILDVGHRNRFPLSPAPRNGLRRDQCGRVRTDAE